LIFSSQCNGVSGVDPLTGKVLWEVPLSFKGRTISSPVLAGDLVIASDGAGTSGKVLVLQAGDSFKLLATNPLGEKSQATPAVAHGNLYLRTLTSLICVPGKG